MRRDPWRLSLARLAPTPSPVRPTTRRRPSYAVGVPNPVPNAKPILIADGWRKRSGPFYTRPLTPDALGVLALSPNRGLPYQWRLQPFVGIRHDRVNALAGALVAPGWKSPYPEPTIRYRLVKLLDGPEARERDSWLIASEALDGNERVFREVADAARDVGLPWMQQRTGLDAIIYELENGNGHGRRTPLLTVALWMKGEVAAAEAQLELIASQFGAPAPRVPEPLRGARVRVTSFGSLAPPEGWPRHAFDAFATRLRKGMAQHPEGPPADWSPQPD